MGDLEEEHFRGGHSASWRPELEDQAGVHTRGFGAYGTRSGLGQVRGQGREAAVHSRLRFWRQGCCVRSSE